MAHLYIPLPERIVNKVQMKNNIRLFAVAIIAAVAAFAARGEFRWGPTAGVDFTNLIFKQDIMRVDKAIGPTLGVQGEMMFPGIGFGIDIGAMYSMQGATLHLGEKKIWAVDGYGKERSYLHTLSIPVNLRFKWTRMNGLEDYIAPYVFGGPVFDFHLGHNSLKAMNYAFGSIGMQAGLGVELWKRWQVQGSYVWGLTYAMKAVKLIDFSGRCSYWTVRVAYMF